MKFSHPKADVCVPASGLSAEAALARVTHLCIAAHQDDVEIMAHAGICECLDAPDRRAFGSVVVTDGAGSPRQGVYELLTDEEMKDVRRAEQRRAADLGAYGIQIQLAHPSRNVKEPGHRDVASDLDQILTGCRAEVIYLHNPADKHDTHVALLARCIEALRRQPADRRPRRVLGCEVWRGLDWLVDTDKVALDAGRRPQLAAALLEVFDSQISGGKRYDLATIGRRAANATYHLSHATDALSGVTWAMDLTPLIADPTLSLEDFSCTFVQRLQDDVRARIRKAVATRRPEGSGTTNGHECTRI